MNSVKGRCDRCGVPIEDHAGATPDDRHGYRCAADDTLRALRRERFTGCADDHGYRTYDPETHTYTRVHVEPDVSACVYSDCPYTGPHGRWWLADPNVETSAQHVYRRPDDATLLTRMRWRRTFRAVRRQQALGSSELVSWVWHVFPEHTDDDPYGVNALYEDLPSAVWTTVYLMELSRMAMPVRTGPDRWYLSNDEAGYVAHIARRAVTRRVKR